jgi:two-component system cell cycle response regulator DivK
MADIHGRKTARRIPANIRLRTGVPHRSEVARQDAAAPGLFSRDGRDRPSAGTGATEWWMTTILLVEDHEEVWEMLSRRLRRQGFEVSIAVDGRQAIAACATERPDLVLLDMNLPETDGWAVARHLKADPHCAEIPIIALTAYGAAEDRIKALQAGCDDHHPKPIDFSRLISQIAAMLKPVS